MNQPRPKNEQKWCIRFLEENTHPGNEGKPLCLLNVWEAQRPHSVEHLEFWDSIVKNWNGKIRFWQIGQLNDPAIEGCEYYFLVRQSKKNQKKIQELIEQAKLLVGIDSSYSSMAVHLGIPIFVKEVPQLSTLKNEIDAFFTNEILKLKTGGNQPCKQHLNGR